MGIQFNNFKVTLQILKFCSPKRDFILVNKNYKNYKNYSLDTNGMTERHY